MIQQQKKEFEKFKQINGCSITYVIENKATFSKINNLIDNVLVNMNSFIFESVEKAKTRGRYTIFGFNPDIILNIHGNDIFLNRRKQRKQNVKKFLEKYIKSFNFLLPKKLPPMSMMLSGYLGYDAVRYYEQIPNNNKDDLKIPDVRLIRPQYIYIHDNQLNKIFYLKLNFKKKTNFASEIGDLKKQVKKDSVQKKLEKKIKKKKIKQKIKSNYTKKKFLSLITKAKEYVYSGDVFQVVLSQRFEKKLTKDPLEVYKKIRILNPSPFLYFFNFKDFQIIGSSPEILVRVRDKMITIRPIAGTRKRGKNSKEDIRLAKELLNDPKELSEHLMLLDLGRNDVGRASVDGTIKVTEKFKIEKYSHVMHIISNVVGKFKNELTVIDALLAGFPAGTVSGAPKIRAMEIIDHLENRKRKLYAGGVGYFSANGDMDTCIALRTALVKNNKIYVQAGAGIVADSIPKNEYDETVNKAKAMLEAAE